MYSEQASSKAPQLRNNSMYKLQEPPREVIVSTDYDFDEVVIQNSESEVSAQAEALCLARKVFEQAHEFQCSMKYAKAEQEYMKIFSLLKVATRDPHGLEDENVLTDVADLLAATYAALASCCCCLSKPKEAIKWADKALKMSEDNSFMDEGMTMLWFSKGQAFMKMKKLLSAKYCFMKVLHYSPEHSEAQEELLRIARLFEQERQSEARRTTTGGSHHHHQQLQQQHHHQNSAVSAYNSSSNSNSNNSELLPSS